MVFISANTNITHPWILYIFELYRYVINSNSLLKTERSFYNYSIE